MVRRRVNVPYWSMPENTAHPTQKPEKLMAKLILASSDRGDVVLDPFATFSACGYIDFSDKYIIL